ncbi:MAG TPA: ABC transporter substrate-binding protein [Verrucomicrobiae bacterium]|jgi:ABC-type nitrate/sulfonate/bicarbonate transport system substrate-binding protein|nr:ABC transporter substrate-binding protein [Verrucomicrobiae bacterium]
MRSGLRNYRPKVWIALAAFLAFLAPLRGVEAQQKIRVATLYIGSSMLPLWIAKDEGDFARRGLDVELIWLQSTLSTYALVASEVDIIFGTPQETLLVMTGANPPPLVTIGSWESNSKHWLMVAPSVQSAKDLVGKSLATSRPKAADEGYARIILKRQGIDSSRVTFISAGGQRDRAGALKSGAAQGSVFNTYNSLALEEAGFKKLALLETPQFPFPPATYTTRKEIALQKREPLKAFMAAVTEATRRHNQDKEIGLRLLKKYMKIQNPKVLEAAYQDGIINQYPYMTREQLDASLDILEASTGVRPKISFEQFVDHSLLQEAKLQQERRN